MTLSYCCWYDYLYITTDTRFDLQSADNCRTRKTRDWIRIPFSASLCKTFHISIMLLIIILILMLMLMLILMLFPVPWFHLQRCYLSCLPACLSGCLAAMPGQPWWCLCQAIHSCKLRQFLSQASHDDALSSIKDQPWWCSVLLVMVVPVPGQLKQFLSKTSHCGAYTKQSM